MQILDGSIREVTAVKYIRGKYPDMASRTAAAEAAEQAIAAKAAAESAAAEAAAAEKAVTGDCLETQS